MNVTPAPIPAPHRLWRMLPLATAAAALPAAGTVIMLGALPVVAQWLKEAGNLGMFVYYLGFVTLCGLALLPTWVAAVMAGWAFGAYHGSVLALISAASAATIGYWTARLIAGETALEIIESSPRLYRLYRYLQGGRGFASFSLVALLRLPPNSGFALMNVLLAAARVRFIPFILGTLAGLIPRTAALAFASAEAATLDLSRASSFRGLIVSLVVLLVVVGGATLFARRALQRI